ncbi:MAG: alpha-glucan family phosphorylase [Phycisphaeraceae bacterium]|nr:alpha-glucan family phosphorylase [Phycisphaeraceae bacterium]
MRYASAAPNETLGIDPRVAYFTMEIGLSDTLPTYSGGLGILAGDTIRSAANLHVPLVCVCLLHREGYFIQTLDKDGTQRDEPVRWQPEQMLRRLEPTISFKLDGRSIHVGAYMVPVKAKDGFTVPVIYLDTNLEGNTVRHRNITSRLYGGDDELRLRQEAVLGIGGVRMLEALRCQNLKIYHMNEGHASLLVPELVRHTAKRMGIAPNDRRVIDTVRERCVFTTHTPVPAGHDRFPMDMVHRILDPDIAALLSPEQTGAMREAPVPASPGSSRTAKAAKTATALAEPETETAPTPMLNMTLTGFALSGRINAVARRHTEVSRMMFGRDDILSVTNGVHAKTWVCGDMAKLFDNQLPGWREDNTVLRGALGLDPQSLLKAHLRAKIALIDRVNEIAKVRFDAEVFTLGFGRRATAYKRLNLLYKDPERLDAIAKDHGGMQIILAGKAHPKDEPGQAMIVDTLRKARKLKHAHTVYLPNYNMDLCGLMVAGSDVWLNTPRPPLEASGTSGMKAALNGVPSLSTLDGWWLEGCVEGLTGWAIGQDDFAPGRKGKPPTTTAQDKAHAADLYDKLDQAVLPAYVKRKQWASIMAHTIALNGAHFTTQRMVREYVAGLYFV